MPRVLDGSRLESCRLQAGVEGGDKKDKREQVRGTASSKLGLGNPPIGDSRTTIKTKHSEDLFWGRPYSRNELVSNQKKGSSGYQKWGILNVCQRGLSPLEKIGGMIEGFNSP